jgi:hypothetical protein
MSSAPFPTPTYNSGVAGSTTILTDAGPVVLDTIVGQYPQAWNGVGWEEMFVEQVSENEPLYLVTLSDSRTLTCSDGYPWYMQVPNRTYPFMEVKTRDLEVGVPVWWTTLSTDVEGAPPSVFPTIASITSLGTTGNTYCVKSSTNLAVYNGILAAVGTNPSEDVIIPVPTPTPAPAPAPTPSPSVPSIVPASPTLPWLLVSDTLSTAGLNLADSDAFWSTAYGNDANQAGDVAIMNALFSQYGAASSGIVAIAKFVHAEPVVAINDETNSTTSTQALTLSQAGNNFKERIKARFSIGGDNISGDLIVMTLYAGFEPYAFDNDFYIGNSSISFPAINADGFWQQQWGAFADCIGYAQVSYDSGAVTSAFYSFFMDVGTDSPPPYALCTIYDQNGNTVSTFTAAYNGADSAQGTANNNIIPHPFQYYASVSSPPFTPSSDDPSTWLAGVPLFGPLTVGNTYYLVVTEGEPPAGIYPSFVNGEDSWVVDTTTLTALGINWSSSPATQSQSAYYAAIVEGQAGLGSALGPVPSGTPAAESGVYAYAQLLTVVNSNWTQESGQGMACVGYMPYESIIYDSSGNVLIQVGGFGASIVNQQYAPFIVEAWDEAILLDDNGTWVGTYQTFISVLDTSGNPPPQNLQATMVDGSNNTYGTQTVALQSTQGDLAIYQSTKVNFVPPQSGGTSSWAQVTPLFSGLSGGGDYFLQLNQAL